MFLFHGVHPKKISVSALILTLLFSALAGSLLVDVADADPIIDMGLVPPKSTTAPPTILISDPQNNTTTKTSNIWFTFNITFPRDPNLRWCNLIEVYYSTSWQPSKVSVYNDDPYGFKESVWWDQVKFWEDEVRLSGIPQGTNTVTVTAVFFGRYEPYTYPGTFAMSTISGSSTVAFAVDLKPLVIGVLSPVPQAYSVSDVPLTFTTNENAVRLEYCLDGQESVSVSGNLTLAGLSEGNHTVTIYGFDEFGNPGTSEAVTFTVAKEAFPTTLVVAAVAIAVVVSFGLVAYLLRRKKRRPA
jgi:hypothetical protein